MPTDNDDFPECGYAQQYQREYEEWSANLPDLDDLPPPEAFDAMPRLGRVSGSGTEAAGHVVRNVRENP